MLEVCASIDGARRVNLTDLATQNGISSLSLYSVPFRRLLELNLLAVDEERPEDDRRSIWYRPTECGLWRTAKELTP